MEAYTKKISVIEFAPKAIATIIVCQGILSESANDKECLERLRGVLQDSQLVDEIAELKTTIKEM